MAHNELDPKQPLDSKTWEATNEFSLWLHAQHDGLIGADLIEDGLVGARIGAILLIEGVDHE